MDTRQGHSVATGIDGESIDGEYCLIGSGSDWRSALRGRLSSAECFEFLLGEAAKGNRLYGYGIGYDVCHWIRDLTNSQKDRLIETGRTFAEFGLRFYRVTYKPNLLFKVERLKGVPTSEEGRKVTGSALVTDLMRWHRKPFADVADEWNLGNENERESVRAVKEDRGEFTQMLRPIVERYNQAECGMIAELAGEMHAGLRSLGIPTSYPLSVGAVAGKLATKYNVDAYHSVPPPEIREASQRAFYGGRVQCARFGHFPDGARQYDIRSAYGWALTQLPDLLGTWHRRHTLLNVDLTSEYGLSLVAWNFDEGKNPVMPFPHRNKEGYIHYPPSGIGWQWNNIVRAAVDHFGTNGIQILDGWYYYPATNYRPFWYVSDLHAQRMALQNSEDPLAGMLKLIMVATWGRLCSQPSQGNPFRRGYSPTRDILEWAGMVTSLIQERILRAILMNPEGFISCCVDGYWTDHPSWGWDQLGEGLGDWELERETRELLLLRPTCFWYRDDLGDWRGKASGIQAEGELAEEVLREWKIKGYRGSISVPQKRCRGLRQCHREGQGYDKLGEFENSSFILQLNPGFGRSGHICPTQAGGGENWSKWLPYWPPVSLPDKESAAFAPKGERSMIEEEMGSEIEELRGV